MSIPGESRRGRRRAARTPDAQMTLVEHLHELRYRLAISVVAIVLAMIVVFLLWQPLFEFLKQPYCKTSAGARQKCDLVALGIFDQFKVRMRVAGIGGVVLAAPVWLYQVGAFITPALHRKEKRYAAAFLAASLVLFAVGTVFAYLTIAQGLDFLLRIGGEGVVTLTSVQSYLSFVTLCLLAFGVAFEFPVVVTFLNLVGLFPVATMRRWRRGMIVAIFAASAVITPSQDPFTFVIMAVPICLLYELCIVIGRFRERAARRRQDAEAHSRVPDDVASPLDLTPSPVDAEV
jgi:sec-independent protein translocase protein TatC